MNLRQNNSLTLIELIIAIVLMGLIVLGFSSIDIFSRYQVIGSDRWAKAQNEASSVLEHMSKEIGKAIGDITQFPVTITPIGGNTGILVWIDYNQNGRRDTGDRQIAYAYVDSPKFQMRYYANYSGNPGSYEIISPKITGFTRSLTDNYVNIIITACYDPDGTPDACATRENPSVTMHTRIKMPLVSTN